MLTLSHVHFQYDVNAPVLSDISLKLETGSLTGFLGPDGAGKSTLFKNIATLLSPSTGRIMFNEEDIHVQRSSIRKQIGFMSERFSLYEDLTVEENLQFFGHLYGYATKDINERMDRLYTFSRLGEFRKRSAGQLSGGMKQKLALSCMLMHDPDLLILDEPTTGVDPTSRDEFWELLKELKGQGRTILVSSPYIDEVAACDNIVVVDKGRILGSGPASWWTKQVLCPVYVIKGKGAMALYRTMSSKIKDPLFLFGQKLHWFDVKKRGQRAIEEKVGKSFSVEAGKITLEDAILWTLHQAQ